MDEACTIKPSGMTNRLFVKFNFPFRINGEQLWGSYADPSKMLFIFTPTTEAPKESYQVRGFRNFLSDERYNAFEAGDVVKIVNVLESVDVSNIQTKFYL